MTTANAIIDTYELSFDELDFATGGNLSFGGIIGAGIAGAAGGAASNVPGAIQSHNWGNTAAGAVGGFVVGAVTEIIRELRF